MRERNRVFTLIELLIVVSIIAILAAMLLPALNKAREKAKSIGCRNQVKQFLTITFAYANDFRDNYPFSYVYTSMSEIGWGKGAGRNFGLFVDLNYISDKSMMYVCPAFDARRLNTYIGTNRRIQSHLSSYGWLPALTGSTNGSPDATKSKYCKTMKITQKPEDGGSMVVLLDNIENTKWNTSDLKANLHWNHYNVGWHDGSVASVPSYVIARTGSYNYKVLFTHKW